MSEEILATMRSEIAFAIKVNVNGKIDRLADQLAEHINQHANDQEKLDSRFDPEGEHYILKDVKPLIEAYRGSKILGEFLKWMAQIGIAYAVLKGFRL